MAVSNQEFLVANVPGVDSLKPKIIKWRRQEKVLDKWLVKRLETILPQVMKRSGIDCWIICNKEYNEDPVYWTISPFSAIEGQSQNSIEKEPMRPSEPKKVPGFPEMLRPPILRLRPANFSFFV